eukprot:GDKI01015268.1.p1 GENE.GDKI01015268.1~~GDKI01015268.1.p1  ORF type:complete len:702 (+),score=224.42 GDKI01015268.1:71-2176(+)
MIRQRLAGLRSSLGKVSKFKPTQARCISTGALHSSNSTGQDGSYGSSSSMWSQRLLLAGAVSAVAHLTLNRKWTQSAAGPVECCGIVAYLGDKEVQPILMEGIHILQNRGYDSCGMSTISADGRIVTTKYASKGTTSDCVDLLQRESVEYHKGHNIGIAHTRWATHGGKTDPNAHPHHDYKGRISLVHNGTIENYSKLKDMLISKGVQFKSQTDTEVIANLIGMFLDEGENFEKAVDRAVGMLEGTWGLAIIHKECPDRIVIARNGSPLIVGCTDNQVFVASEPAALARHTNQYMALKDGEIAVLTRDGVDHLLGSDRTMQKIHLEDVQASPAPWSHWTIKEIFEQPLSLARALNYGGRITMNGKVKLGGLDDNRERLLKIKHMLLVACGTSLYASIYGERLMEFLGCFDTVRSVDASEVETSTLPKDDAGMCLISQSGETLDVVRACQVGDQAGIPKLSVVNVVGSLVARMTGMGVYLNAGREVAVASTKAFTSQVTVLALIASWFAQNKPDETKTERRQILMDAVHRLPVYAGMTLQCKHKCANIAEKIKDADSLFVLGKGFAHPVALEGALKIKEISYIHAEGFPGGALKHGPFALIDEKKKTPVILMVFSDQHAPLMINAAEQVRARGARLIFITDDASLVSRLAEDPEDVIVVPSNGPLTALLASIPLQLIAYQLAVARGIDPDKPRGLAKTVTVS